MITQDAAKELLDALKAIMSKHDAREASDLWPKEAQKARAAIIKAESPSTVWPCAAVADTAYFTAANIAMNAMVVGNDLLDTEIGRNEAAQEIADAILTLMSNKESKSA